MADQTLWPVRGRTRAEVRRAGNFTMGAAGAITGTSERNFTVSRIAAGLYVVTLDDRYVLFTGGNVFVAGATNYAAWLYALPYLASGRTSLTIGTATGGTTGDPPSGYLVGFDLAFRDSSAP